MKSLYELYLIRQEAGRTITSVDRWVGVLTKPLAYQTSRSSPPVVGWLRTLREIRPEWFKIFEPGSYD